MTKTTGPDTTPDREGSTHGDTAGLTQPTISHHLKILVDAGIFTRDKRGVWAYYALVPSAMDALAAVLSTAD